jgi:hypothetical protein
MKASGYREMSDTASSAVGADGMTDGNNFKNTAEIVAHIADESIFDEI